LNYFEIILEVKAMNDPVLQKAIKEWHRLSQDPKTRAQYLSRLKWKMDYFSSIKTAESKGRAEGEAKGRAEGRAEGLTEGKIKAKQDDIYKFLARRFGIEPAGIQEKVQQLTDLNLFGRRFD
jgi:flagellar biosynthesis/type III secretory pathway protein FliH